MFNTFKKISFFGVVGLPILFFWYLFFKYALDAPLWDDFALIDFILKIHARTNTLGQNLSLFFAQHNAHRIVYDRLMFYCVYELTGKINFKILMFIGNLSLMGILYYFYKSLSVSRLSAWIFVPIPFLLLSLQGHENTFWAMASLQNYGVLCWVMASLYYLTINKKLALSIFFAVLATFTSGNGLFVFGLGILALWLQNRPKQTFLAWGISAVASISLYFWQYSRLPQEVLSTKFIINFFSFMGAAFADGSANYKVPFVVGILLFISILLLFLSDLNFKKYAFGLKQLPDYKQFIYLFIGFLFISALLVATSHKEGLPIEETLVSRYKIYAHLLIISLYILLVFKQFKTPVLFGIGLGFAIIFNSYSFFQTYPTMAYNRRNASVAAFNLQYNRSCIMGISHAEATNQIYKKLSNKGIYSLPQILSYPLIDTTKLIALNITTLNQKLPYYMPLVKTLSIENQDFIVSEENTENGPYLVLRSDKNLYLFNPHYNQNGKKAFATSGQFYRKGFGFEVHEPLLPASRYEVMTMVVEDGKSTVYPSGKWVDIF